MQAIPGVSRRALAAAGALVAAALACALLLPAPDPSGLEADAIVPGLLFVVAIAWWAAAATGAARRRTGWERGVWQWFAASGYFALFTVVLLSGAAGVEGAEAAAQAVVSVLSIGLYALLFAGLVVMAARQAQRGEVARIVLDSAIIAGSLFFILWSALYRDLYSASSLDDMVRNQMLGYLVFDSLLLALAALTLIGRDPNRPKGYTLLLVGLAILVVTDTASAPLTLVNPDLGARIFVVGDVVGLLFLVGAALSVRAGPPWPKGAVRTESLPLRLLPIFPLGLALLTAFETVREFGAISALQFWVASFVITLVAARLCLTIVLNARLEAELRSSLEGRTRLLRFVSHEIANPLSPLVLQARLLRDAGPQDRVAAVAIMDRSLARLRRLSEDVRDLAMAETGRLAARTMAVDLAVVAAASVAAAAADADAKRIAVGIEPGSPAPCLADADRIGQVLDNLLSNAIKYTPAGGHVRVTVRTDGAGARCQVEDDGAGLAPEDAAHLFEPFRRFHTHSAAGLGLGLHLCKAIVESHGGRIGASSAGPGKGATFWFWIPEAVAVTPG